MTLSIYDACMPAFVAHLEAFSGILDKAAAHCAARKIEPAVLLHDRLYPDMLPFTKQIQIATDHVKNLAARLAGAEPPPGSYMIDPDETAFDEVKDRIAKTVAYLKSFRPEQFEGAEDREISLKPYMDMTVSGAYHMSRLVQPNFFFQLTVAYCILRHNGVELGKWDFMGPGLSTGR